MRIPSWFITCLLLVSLCSGAWSQPESEPQAKPDVKTESKTSGGDDDFLKPSGGQLGVGEEGFGLGTAVGDPTALYGPTRNPMVLFGTDRESLLDLQGYYIHKFNDRHRFVAEGHIDPAFGGVDLSYSARPKGWDGAIVTNAWVSTGTFAPFNIEHFEVLLPAEEESFVQSLGAGVEYVAPVTDKLDLAVGLNYAQYGFSDELLVGTRYSNDIQGAPITVGTGISTERFLALRLNGIYSTLDDRDLPTKGTKLRFGMEQTAGLGGSPASFNRVHVNWAHLFPVPGFNDGNHSLLLNVQAGGILGNPPPIRAFHLGGAASVRGYDPGELASGKSFFQGSLEYRHHLKSFQLLERDVEARFALFYDYATNFETDSQLGGMPPQLSNKLSHGYGYGGGLHLATKYGLFRFETAWNGQGRNGFFMTVGERF